ncbi:MAG: pyruvate dehydrogenase (acetyl-transferring) E1 component subunit alpha [Deltaproteobacteria bacterium]
MNDEEIVSVLRPDGGIDPARDPGLTDAELLSIHRNMVLLRAIDEKAVALQRSGRVGFFVPSTGQEACSVGAGHAVREGDWIFPSYRDHGVGLMRGYPLASLIGQILGNSTDATRGRQMPNHWCDSSIRLVSVSSPVATQLPHAAGAAYAAKARGERIAVLATFGDGGTSTGDFHAAMNFAGVFRLPLVFFCENNRYAISCPVERQTVTATLAEKAAAYGFPGVRVDGNDVLAVRKVVGEAMERARAGEGPTMIEALTYRMGPHSTSDDPTVYRSAGEVEAWRERDPIRRFGACLVARGLLADPAAVEMDAKESLRRALEAAEAAPPVPLSSMFDDVYADMPWHLAEQRDALLFAKG